MLVRSGLAALLVAVGVSGAYAEVVRVSLPIDYPIITGKLYNDPDHWDLDTEPISGFVTLDLTMDFDPGSQEPAAFRHAEIVGSRWGVFDQLKFKVPLDDEFPPSMYLFAETWGIDGFGGKVLGASPIDTPDPAAGEFPASRIRVVINRGEYRWCYDDDIFDHQWQYYSFDDAAWSSYNRAGTGEIGVTLASVDGDSATYDVSVNYPLNFSMYYPFAWLTVQGGLPLTGEFTRSISEAGPPGLYSVSAGDWNDPSVWDGEGATPGEDHDVVVGAQTVTVSGQESAASLMLSEPTGKVAIEAGQSLSLGHFADTIGTVEVAAQGVLSVQDNFTMQDGARYACDVGGSGAGLVDVAGHVNIADSELVLRAGQPYASVGYHSAPIIQAADEDGILGYFMQEPPYGEHLGHGAFYEGLNYGLNNVEVSVFQAVAGDVNGDHFFNFDDIFTMFYESGAVYGNDTGTGRDWTGGDFNGDENFTFEDIFDAFFAAGSEYGSTAPYAAGIQPPEPDGAISVRYDPATGNLTVGAGDTQLWLLSIRSADGLLRITPEGADVLDGFGDVQSASLAGKLDLSGFSGELDFGAALAAMLTRDDLLADLSVEGVLAGGGPLGRVDLVVSAVPEPPAVVLLLVWVGLLSAWHARARRSTAAGRRGAGRACPGE